MRRRSLLAGSVLIPALSLLPKRPAALLPAIPPAVSAAFKIVAGAAAAWEIGTLALGARAAAFALADDMWDSDPSGITQEQYRGGEFPWEGGMFADSAEAQALATSSSSANKISVIAKSEWNPFRYTGTIKFPHPKEFDDTGGFIWAEGFARGAEAALFKHFDIARETKKLGRPNSEFLGVPVSIDYEIEEQTLVLPKIGGRSYSEIDIHAWLKDDNDTTRTTSSWSHEVFSAKTLVSSDFSELIYARGGISRDRFEQFSRDKSGHEYTKLKNPVKDQKKITVPIPNNNKDSILIIEQSCSLSLSEGKK